MANEEIYKKQISFPLSIEYRRQNSSRQNTLLSSRPKGQTAEHLRGQNRATISHLKAQAPAPDAGTGTGTLVPVVIFCAFPSGSWILLIYVNSLNAQVPGSASLNRSNLDI